MVISVRVVKSAVVSMLASIIEYPHREVGGFIARSSSRGFVKPRGLFFSVNFFCVHY